MEAGRLSEGWTSSVGNNGPKQGIISGQGMIPPSHDPPLLLISHTAVASAAIFYQVRPINHPAFADLRLSLIVWIKSMLISKLTISLSSRSL